MILLLDTSTSLCKLTLIDGDQRFDYEWQADRQLSKGLHNFIHEKLNSHGWKWQDISAIGAYKGPGSFTGLRIGLTVVNSLGESLSIPIVGATGDDWRAHALKRLDAAENDKIILPEYGSDAHITKPRK